jgi:hypothetical protein
VVGRVQHVRFEWSKSCVLLVQMANWTFVGECSCAPNTLRVRVAAPRRTRVLVSCAIPRSPRACTTAQRCRRAQWRNPLARVSTPRRATLATSRCSEAQPCFPTGGRHH